MGYQGEKASVNQYKSLYDYVKSNVFDTLTIAFNVNKKHTLEGLKKQLPFVYVSKIEENNSVPLVSFDGGIATLFPNELPETKLIKVAAASPPQWADSFKDYLTDAFFHVSSGFLRWPKGADLDEEEIIIQTIDNFLKNPMTIEFLDHLGIDHTEFKQEMIGHLKYKAGSQVEDCFREIMEWMLIINFCVRQKNNKNLNFKQTLPYLIVKDGSLYPYSKTVSSIISGAIERFLDNEQIFIVGMVKSSRFLSDDGIYRRTIQQYMKGMNQNTFFKLPKELEKKIDSKDINYERIFFSIFGGKSVYEVQISQAQILRDPKVLTQTLDVLNSQVTFQYGGSISTNSFAHIEASLSDREAKHLTNNLRHEIYEKLKENDNESSSNEDGDTNEKA